MVRGATEVRGRGGSQGRQQRGLRGRGEGAGPGGQRQGCVQEITDTREHSLEKCWT